MEKIAIFVDVQNIYYTCRDGFQANFDYNKFWAKITKNKQVVKAIAYATYRNDEKQKQFQNILRAIGFEVKLKNFITRSDGSSKGDWDVGIAIDVLEYASEVDKVILASGDGDFDLLMSKIKQKYKVKTEIYGVKDLTADSLIEASDKFSAIDQSLLIIKK